MREDKENALVRRSRGRGGAARRLSQLIPVQVANPLDRKKKDDGPHHDTRGGVVHPSNAPLKRVHLNSRCGPNDEE